MRFGPFMSAVVTWLDRNFLRSGATALGVWTIERFLNLKANRGIPDTIRSFKESRAGIHSYLASLDARKWHSPLTLKSLKVPRRIRGFIIRSQKTKVFYPVIRLALTSLYLTRGLYLEPKPNMENITPASTMKEIPGFYDHVESFWLALGCSPLQMGTIPSSVRWRRFHFTTKSGPNGPALWSAIADLHKLPRSLLDSIRVIGGERLASSMERLLEVAEIGYTNTFFDGVKPRLFRRIAAIPSQEGKTREVAILDYWSQTCLKPVHNYLFLLLKRIPQDCTFAQGSFISKLPKWDETTHKYHSFDLKAATDRFPIEVICRILEPRFTPVYVKHWRNIMVGYPFRFGDQDISYGAGNPMGAYSSWNSFALAHHYVLYYCSKVLGIDWKCVPYVLLGDDIVIKHDGIAKVYKEVIESLGVEISIAKSHISPYFYEFAKRIIHQDVEVTPFPIAALWETRKQPSMMLNVVDSESRKGWNPTEEIPAVLAKLFVLLKYNHRRVMTIKKMLLITSLSLKTLKGNLSAQDALKAIAERYFPNLNTLAIKIPDLIWQLVIVKLQQKSMKGHSERGKSLFESADAIKELDRDRPIPVNSNAFLKLFSITDYYAPPKTKEERAAAHKRRRSIPPTSSSLAHSGFMAMSDVEQFRYDYPVESPEGYVNTTNDTGSLLSNIPFMEVCNFLYMMLKEFIEGTANLSKLLTGDWKTKLRSLQLPESDKVFRIRNQDIRTSSSYRLAKGLTEILTALEKDPTHDKVEILRKLSLETLGRPILCTIDNLEEELDSMISKGNVSFACPESNPPPSISEGETANSSIPP